MAQISKKVQIAESALPLFLTDGFKATSIDKVVKASNVSKPTIYNHFPDKEALLFFALQHWLDQNMPAKLDATSELNLQQQIKERWLSADAIRFYGLFIGEGFRATEAKALFLTLFDEPWRQALRINCQGLSYDNNHWQQYVSHQIVASRLYIS